MAIDGTSILQGLNRCLDELHQQTGAFIQSYQHRPAASSAAAKEQQAFAKPELITSVHSQGIVRIEVAADHMIALGRAITEPVLVFPAWVCVRALLEASASAAWLLDPGIDADTRVRRSYSLRFEGLIQQKKIAHIQGDAKVVADIVKRVDELAAEATSLGFKARQDKQGANIGIDPQFPGPTELVKDVLGENILYRIASGVAHSHDYAITQLGYKLDDSRRVDHPGAVGNEVAVTKHMSFEQMFVLYKQAAEKFTVPVGHLTQLFGWDMNRLGTIVVDFKKAVCGIIEPLRI
jgi:hypothetical protein